MQYTNINKTDVQVMAVSFELTNTFKVLTNTFNFVYWTTVFCHLKFKIKHWKEKELNYTLISQQNK